MAPHAGAPPRRTGLTAGLRHMLTLTGRGLRHIRRNPDELFDLSFTPVMLLLLFTYVFGGAVLTSTGEYLQFVLPGVIVMSSMLATMSTGMSLNSDVTKGYFDRLRGMPIARSAPLAGHVLTGSVKQAYGMALLLGLGALLGFRVGTDPVAVLAAFALLLAFSFGLSWIAIYVGVWAGDPEKVQNVGFVIVFPAAFTSGAFVPKDTMPGWLMWWVETNPAAHLVAAVRGLLTGPVVVAPIWYTLAWSVGLVVVLLPLAVRAMRHR
ncbi:ABC transporter permease [Amycolatopsis cihanbeyliensis]|uniref:Transport permease protein n=1 Tax=Amycolatopsis cihanbeyliensis TaxID=1128664 RepID=A0A542DBR6_AMYCI|nr:ABC transporter permease [Amycolatopsis cihanbeyliensis]TQJ00507.1 ABC-2 type transport system permease protein/oleandomycin transport system permease protein [Amycolatopsis cihanbeyliensis]